MKNVMWGLILLLILPVAPSPLQSQTSRQVSVESLLYDLKNPDAQRRKEAVVALGRNKVRAAVPALVEAAADSDEGVRSEVIVALVQIGDPRALPAYIGATRENSPYIKNKAIEGIINAHVIEESGFLAATRKLIDAINPFSEEYDTLVVEPYVRVSPETIQALAPLTRDDSTAVRKNSARALGILRARSAVSDLALALKVESDPGVKLELIRALEKIGDPDSGQHVAVLVEDPDKRVHDEAIRAVGVLGYHAAAPRLVELFNSGVEERRKIFRVIPASGADDLQQKILQALAMLGAPEARGIFINHLSHADPHYRQYAAEGLARLGAQDLVTTVSKARITEDRPNVQAALSFALFKLGREEYLLDLVTGLGDGRRSQVLDHLAELTPQQTTQLYPYLESRSARVREGVALAIGRTGDSSAIPHLEKMLRDPDSDVLAAVNLSIRRVRASNRQ